MSSYKNNHLNYSISNHNVVFKMAANLVNIDVQCLAAVC